MYNNFSHNHQLMKVFKIVKGKIKDFKELRPIFQKNNLLNKFQKLHLKDKFCRKMKAKQNRKYVLQKTMIINQEECL